MSRRWFLSLFSLALAGLAYADGPADNLANQVRPIPPKGITLTASDRSQLEAGVNALGKEIESLREAFKTKRDLLALLPDVQIYHNAVRYALAFNEFFSIREIGLAKTLLKQGVERAVLLRAGKTPWNSTTGLLVRGYVSTIDGSVQPYGLVVPASYQANTPHRFRLDVWCHGRGETLSELSFINGRQSSPGEFAPAHAFVLHPYGRYCNANRFAGEIDLFEAINDIKQHYPIDLDRVVMRGFSMGGAACWQFAVHYPSEWCAATPGAGFAETADFLKVFQNEPVEPAWYEKKLWHLYDCTDYALNLFNCPTVAYSGENDRQKQAADMMAKALKDEGIELVHVKGARAGHQYTPAAKIEINRRIDQIVQVGRDPVPSKVFFTTWTLRYNRSFWVEIDGLEHHWERARVKADLLGGPGKSPDLKTENISALTLRLPAGRAPLALLADLEPKAMIDDQVVSVNQPRSDRSWTAHFRKDHGKWALVPSDDDGTLHKRHGLQGPIDDAFMGSFLMVKPTGAAFHERVEKWVEKEMTHAVEHWRRQFRGEARVKVDKEITEEDMSANNLVLWGDPQSNAVLAKVIASLPVKWDNARVQFGADHYDATHHVPVLIYPNPLNPKRYIVLNSGFTFREYDYLNNARQVPKLPDYAVVDVNSPVTSRAPGRIVTANFFNEDWGLPSVK